MKDLVEIQIVAFPQEGILSYPNGKQLMTAAVQLGADAVGAIPHYEFTREYSVESLDFALHLAKDTGKLVDVHCDEIDDEALVRQCACKPDLSFLIQNTCSDVLLFVIK